MHNTGDADVSGGAVDATCTPAANCTAGGGARILLLAQVGTLVESATLRSVGGASPAGAGGRGGAIALNVTQTGSSTVPAGNLLASGNMDVSGGSGATGALGGTISFKLSVGQQAAGQELILLGYSSIAVDGGAGTTAGGKGGLTGLSLNSGFTKSQTIPAGAAINYADVSAVGGTASAGPGGQGGNIYLATQSTSFFTNAPFETTTSAGNLDASGGQGTTGAGGGGFIFVYGRAGATVTGAIKGRAGAATAAPGAAGGDVTLLAENGPLNNAASLDFSGGAAAGANNGGGSGGKIKLSGFGLTNSGTLLVPGGAADPRRSSFVARRSSVVHRSPA